MKKIVIEVLKELYRPRFIGFWSSLRSMRWEGEIMVDRENGFARSSLLELRASMLSMCWAIQASKKGVPLVGERASGLNQETYGWGDHFAFGCGYSSAKYWGRIKQPYNFFILGLWRIYLFEVHTIKKHDKRKHAESVAWVHSLS